MHGLSLVLLVVSFLLKVQSADSLELAHDSFPMLVLGVFSVVVEGMQFDTILF